MLCELRQHMNNYSLKVDAKIFQYSQPLNRNSLLLKNLPGKPFHRD